MNTNAVLKILTSLCILIISSLSNCQVIGTYFGKDYLFTRYDSIKKDSIKYFDEKEIILMADNLFYFQYLYPGSSSITTMCEGCIDTLRIEGKWKLNHDTIILSTKYFDLDQFTILELSDSSNYTCFAFLTAGLGYPSLHIKINRNYDIKVLSHSVNTFEKVKIDYFEVNMYRGGLLHYIYKYVPKSSNSNIFVITFNAEAKVNSNECCVNNEKFVLRSGRLTPINVSKLLKVNTSYIKK